MTDDPREYDLIVIGAGPAGGNAASTAAELGASVAQVECDRMGGTCLNYGCDPTKALLTIAELVTNTRLAERQGLHVGGVTVDWPAVRSRVQEVLNAVRGAASDAEAREHSRDKGIDVYDAQARFISAHEVQVGEHVLRGRAFVIATGTRTMIPPVEGLEEAGYITNVEAVSLPVLPAHLAVAGGGPLGVEFAQLFQRLGCEVTLIEEQDTLLPKDDPGFVATLSGLLAEDGVTLRTGHKLARVEQAGSGKRLTLQPPDGPSETIEVDELLMALGRQPVTDTLSLSVAGVTVDAKGGIEADACLRTSAPHIYAAGDVLGDAQFQFTHVASDQGKLAARNALGAEQEQFDYDAIPWVTYTDPQLAHLGSTEAELDEAGTSYTTASAGLDNMTVPLSAHRAEGGVKLLVGDDGRLLGAHILAASGGDLLAPLALIMRNGLPLSALQRTIMPFPSPIGAVRTAARAYAGPREAAVR